MSKWLARARAHDFAGSALGPLPRVPIVPLVPIGAGQEADGTKDTKRHSASDQLDERSSKPGATNPSARMPLVNQLRILIASAGL
jgi:hypothetical protein